MEKDLRVSVVAAIAATALSALIGVIAGVGFLALLLRALACGLVVGAAVYGCVFLLRKMVPEILSPVSEAEGLAESRPPVDAQAAQPPAGSNLDIVLPGDEGAPDILGPGEDAFVAAALDEAPAAPSSESVGTVASPAGTEPFPGPSSESVVRAQPNAAGEDIGGASLLEPESSFAGEEGEPAIPPNAAFGSSHRPSSGFDELDVLPDLEGFSDTFSASEFASGGDSPALHGGPERAGSSEGAASSRSSPASGMDPAALAQAVRTILKRDQKG